MKNNSAIVAAYVVFMAAAIISAMALVTITETSYGILQKGKQTSEQQQAQSVAQFNHGIKADQENENEQTQKNDQFIEQKARCSGFGSFTC